MFVDLHDETRRHDQLAGRLTHIVHSIAPLVEEITHLRLPRAPRVRILTPRQWRSEVHHALIRAYLRDISELNPALANRIAARAVLALARVGVRMTWPSIEGATVTTVYESPETLLTAQALEHTGLLWDERALTRCLAHELTCQAQLMACTSDHHWTTLMPRARAVAHLALPALREGHARWAAQMVTVKHFGPLGDAPAPPSTRSPRPLTAVATPGGCALARTRLYVGTRFIYDLPPDSRVKIINRVWDQPHLAPTWEELTRTGALAWLRRMGR